ncbi:MAG: glutamyl-tRNA reductase [Chitinophagaceae bacterium]
MGRFNLSDFTVIGINYKKSDVSVRSQFSIGPEQYDQILSLAGTQNYREIFVLSTCNRTEIYALISNYAHLIDWICQVTGGIKSEFLEKGYIYHGKKALQHLYEVGSGLDSQILGDYEIVGQLKNAVKFAKERGYIGAFLERLISDVLKCSKEIKNHTQISSGTVSVSFAAIQYIKKNIFDFGLKKILIVGTGKMGRLATQNLIDHLDIKNIILTNRTDQKSEDLAQKLHVKYLPFSLLSFGLEQADIIIVATHAQHALINNENISKIKSQLIIDLSVPMNVSPEIATEKNITLVNVDQLSLIKDETLSKRMADLPKAKTIVHNHLLEFIEWNDKRVIVPMLQSLKSTLSQIKEPQQTHLDKEKKIQKILNHVAVNFHEKNPHGGK